MLEVMVEALVRGENVETRGFWNFKVREYKTYTGRNPKTGEKNKSYSEKIVIFQSR